MIPKLHDKTGTVIGDLTDCLKGITIEERNGMLEAEITYQLFSPHWDKLIRGNIFTADVNDKIKNQQFRIYKVGKTIKGVFNVYARHISYDAQRDMIEGLDIQNQSCEYCLNTIFRNSQFSQKFRGHSDIVNAQNFKIGPTKLLSAIGGVRGSIIDTFGTGAEILRDNYDFYVLNKRGNDNGVTIEYSKNMTGLDYTEDEEGLITRIKAIAKYTPEGGEETEIFTYVDSHKILDYETPFIETIDFSDKFEDEEIPTTEKLKILGEKYFKNNKCDFVKFNYKVSFIPLSKCAGYEDIQDKIELCDTVGIKDYRYNLDTKAKVIKTTYDFLRERYDSMEVGEPRTTLGDVVGGGSEESKPGPPGPQGPPGADGNIGDFPDSLPSVPVLSSKVYGFANIELSWTFENKVYYSYELYASKIKDFIPNVFDLIHQPVLSSKVYGFANIELSWTFENKVYYSYELYASKIKDFIPNVFDLIHQGQSSSFLFQAKPNETWYFRACAVNTHGNRTEFSSQIAVTTKKVDDLSNYVDNMAINDALIGTLSLDRGWYGELRGNYIDAKQLSVTDGNGKRTLDIDSFGNVRLDVTEMCINSESVATDNSVKEYTNSQIKVINDSISLYVDIDSFGNVRLDVTEMCINSESVATDNSVKEYTNSQIKVINDSISLYVKKNDLNSLIQQMPESVKVAFNNISSEWIFDTNKFTNKIDGKIGLTLGHGRLNVNRFDDGKPVGYYGQTFSQVGGEGQRFWGNIISGTYNSYFTDIGYNPNVVNDGDSTSTGFVSYIKNVFYPYGPYKSPGIYMSKDVDISEKLTVHNALMLHWHIDLALNNTVRLGNVDKALYKMYCNQYSSSNKEIIITPGISNYGGLVVSGDGYLRPTNTGGAYTLGTTNNPFYKLYSVNTLSSQGLYLNHTYTSKIRVEDSNVLENIDFIQTYKTSNEGLIMDVTKIKDTSYIESDENNNVYMNDGEMIKLLIKEVKQLKEEIKALKGGA